MVRLNGPIPKMTMCGFWMSIAVLLREVNGNGLSRLRVRFPFSCISVRRRHGNPTTLKKQPSIRSINKEADPGAIRAGLVTVFSGIEIPAYFSGRQAPEVTRVRLCVERERRVSHSTRETPEMTMPAARKASILQPVLVHGFPRCGRPPRQSCRRR